ncbi:hypothetical protein LY78DRAFT_481421 [Colletotrichum sublineola]|nr:hypothetical protein LY78DRAFT_481421 [Colletotrichum sublineola]
MRRSRHLPRQSNTATSNTARQASSSCDTRLVQPQNKQMVCRPQPTARQPDSQPTLPWCVTLNQTLSPAMSRRRRAFNTFATLPLIHWLPAYPPPGTYSVQSTSTEPPIIPNSSDARHATPYPQV